MTFLPAPEPNPNLKNICVHLRASAVGKRTFVIFVSFVVQSLRILRALCGSVVKGKHGGFRTEARSAVA